MYQYAAYRIYGRVLATQARRSCLAPFATKYYAGTQYLQCWYTKYTQYFVIIPPQEIRGEKNSFSKVLVLNREQNRAKFRTVYSIVEHSMLLFLHSVPV